MKKIKTLVSASLALILSVFLFFFVPVVSGETVTGNNVLYTTDADYDKGTLLNVNHDINHNQLELNKTTTPFPFINIAASARGTIVRIDVNTGAILGEYYTAPSGMGRNPSRTTVDQFGNVWVANRDEQGYSPAGSNTRKGSIARVGLIIGGTRANADGTPNPSGQYLKPPFEYNTCVDRNSDGLIKTSRGLGNILPWTNTKGADTHGGVSTAEDECIINYTRVIGTGTRTVSIDANNDVWVGGFSNYAHEKVSGVTGQPVPGTQFNLNCGGYGGLIDKSGVLWSAQGGYGLLRFVPNPNPPPAGEGACIGNSMGNYGLGIDPNTGHIWHSSYACCYNSVYEIDPDTAKVINSYPQGFGSQGLAVDGNSHVWVSSCGWCGDTRVAHFAPDPSNPGKHMLVGYITGLNGPTGVAVDANGKIWVAEYFGNSASRIDPNAGPTGGGGYKVGAKDLTVFLGSGATPYNYSDMTGFVAIGSTSPQGVWTITQDSGVTGNKGVTITWNTEPKGIEPEGAAIIVEARASDTETGLSSQGYTEVSNGTPFMLVGRFIQVRAILKPNAFGESPILSDIRIRISPAGTDVHVIDTISTKNIELDLSTFSQEPFSIATEADKTIIEWQFPTFSIGQIENLSFGVLLKNPIPGEDRLVNHKLEVLYTDVNGNPVRTELGPHYVHVLTSAFDSNVSTDKPIYQANEDVNITTTITNISPDMRSPTVKITIEDMNGNIVSEIAEFQINLGPYDNIPFLQNWNNRIKLSSDKTKINSDLTDFPVRLHISATSGINNADLSDIFDKLGTNHKKIAVTTSDGKTQCYVEIERWDSINKEAELWVKVPSISSIEDTTLYLYYDPAQTDNTQYVGDTNSVPSENVWGSNYKAVYHMSQDPSGAAPQILDSTSNNNDGISKGNMTASNLVDGQIGKAISFDGVNDYIEVNNSASLNPGVITIETWAKSNTPTWNEYGFLVSKRNAYILHPNKGTKSITFYIFDEWGGFLHSVSTPNVDIDITQWHQYVGTYDGKTLKIYVDGVLKNSYGHLSSIYTKDTGSLFIGWDDGWAERYFNGIIDEVSISNIAYSDVWIKASYYSQNDNLISFGSIVSIPSTQTYNFTWNTGTTSSGNYLVRAKLYENGTFLTEDTANFTILPDKTLTSKVTTDKVSYTANEPVTITSTIQGTSTNYIFENLNAHITITNPQGTILYTETNTIPILMPGQITELKTYWNTSTNPNGTYTVKLEVMEGVSVLSSSVASFEILSSSETGEGLIGTITAQPNPVYQGRDETITYTVTNNGNEDIGNLSARVIIVDPETQAIKIEYSRQNTAGRGETITEVNTVSTATLTPKTYLVILQAVTPTMPEPKTLASTTFEVKPSLEVTKTIPDVKNVLVWLNYPWQSGQNCPDRLLIEQALNEAGVSYHIVLDKKEFETELRNPYYTDFMILGDHNPIEDHFSEELREQVYSGKGLISSMFNRQNLDGEVFGMKFIGHLSGSDYPVELLESEISAQGDFQSYGRALKVEAKVEAEDIPGWIVETTKKGINKYPGIIKRQYGNGKILFFAFDLGLSSTNYDHFASLLKNSLNNIHNPLDTTAFSPNQFVPVEIKIKSLGGAFDLRITETYPEDIVLYNPVTGQWITDNPWVMNVSLSPNETKTILYYALTPDKAGTYTLQTEVGYMENGTYNFYQSLSTDITIIKNTATMTNDILYFLNALTVSGQDRAKVENAKRYIMNVQQRVIATKNDVDMNIHDLLQAIDSLLSVTSADITGIRLMMEGLLRTWEGRYYYFL